MLYELVPEPFSEDFLQVGFSDIDRHVEGGGREINMFKELYNDMYICVRICTRNTLYVFYNLVIPFQPLLVIETSL